MKPLYYNTTTGELFCQEQIALNDGKRDWSGKKKMTKKVATLISHYDSEKADKLSRCGTYLGFVRVPDGTTKLNTANFCRERLCPMCQWRRSLRLAVQSEKIYRELNVQGYRHIFATITIKNCERGELKKEIDKLYKSVSALFRTVAFRRSFVGAYRALEVTYNEKSETFHPHFHLILTVKPEYFEDSSLYWDTETLVNRWRKSAHLAYDPVCDMRVIKQKEGQTLTSACIEACKYPVKTAEFSDWKVLQEIDYALRGRRLISWWGLPQYVRRALAMDDIEEGNLVHTDDTSVGADELQKIVYVWRHGVYIPLDMEAVNND